VDDAGMMDAVVGRLLVGGNDAVGIGWSGGIIRDESLDFVVSLQAAKPQRIIDAINK
jgi:hypothetical protein